jgi:hypothetical protein
MGELFTLSHLFILFILFFFFVGPIVVIPYWQIFKKAGFPPALSILVLVPIANLVVLYFIAFSDWRRAPGGSPI